MAKSRRRQKSPAPRIILGVVAVAAIAGLLVLLFWNPRRSAGERSRISGAVAGGPGIHYPAIFFTCNLAGHVVPTDSEETTYYGPLGGVARMATLLKEWRDERKDAIVLDVGNFTIGEHMDAPTVNDYVLKALDQLGYEVANCGDNEVALPLDRIMNLPQNRSCKVISANLVRADTHKNIFPSHVILEREHVRVAIVGLVRDDIPPNRIGKGLRILSPADTLKANVGFLKEGAKADFIVVLAYMTPEQLYKLARHFPEVGLFLGGLASCTSAPFELENRSLIAYLGDEGRTVGRIEPFFPSEGPPAATARVTRLDDSINEDDALKPLQDEFRTQVGADRIPGIDHDRKMPATTSFVGAEVCRICHIKKFYSWQKTAHSGAWVTLLTQDKHKDPECLTCHATGFRMPDGFDPAKVADTATPQPAAQEPGAEKDNTAQNKDAERAMRIEEKTQTALKNVGCEACHGGARRHLGSALKDRLATATEPQLRTASALKSCLRCHTGRRPCLDPEKSDPFDMEEYLKLIKHWE